MSALRIVVTGCLVLSLVAFAGTMSRADEKIDKDKIVGTWELTKSTAKDAPPPGTTVEFAKDGKMKIKVKVENKEITLEGTYSIDGAKLNTALKTPDGKEQKDTDTITKLTDKEMVLKGSKGEINEFKKK
jgi:uncharacterized protein (TIGR03066 family)